MSPAELAVEVSGLTIKFGDFTAVDGISFSVQRGEIFGFLGANGAGKTTTIRSLCGLLLPTAGTVKVAGFEFKNGGGDEIKRKVGYMSQRFTLYNDLTVKENLDFASALRKLDRAYFENRKSELLKFVGFSFPLSSLVRDLPGGIKQELSLVVSLLHEPEIIFLDEPTAGVSPVARERFWALIRNLAAMKKTVFVTTHYMDEAEECGRIALMSAGKIIALDTPSRLKSETFPEELTEIEPPQNAPPAWIDKAKQSPGILSLQPHGLRFHAVLKDKRAEEGLLRVLPPGFKTRFIKPSLEDVFIRLVEGGSR